VRADPVVVEQLARIGNNLNQLARWANTERRAVDVAALYVVGRQLAGLRDAVVAAASQEPVSCEVEVVVDLADDDDQDRHLAAGEDLKDDVAGVSVS
jgi:Bacterial mobilisation protein (MobC)